MQNGFISLAEALETEVHFESTFAKLNCPLHLTESSTPLFFEYAKPVANPTNVLQISMFSVILTENLTTVWH